MRHHLPLLSLLFVLLSACATPEFQQANNECMNQGLKPYPVVMRQQIFKRSRQVMVPDGSTICESTSMESNNKNSGITQNRSVCRPGMRQVTEYYDEPGMVDINQAGRETYAANCAANLCLQRFGNAKCKTKN